MTDVVLYEASEGIATLTLNRPDVANAQNAELLDQLDAAWTRAAEDPEVRVIVLQANGKHFSSGHDLGGKPSKETAEGADSAPAPVAPPKLTLQGIYEYESRRYLEYSLRWRNTPKPSIAAVQGVCIAGGLLLAWPCDLIVASEDAKFSDPVVAMGIGGVEYHGHTWEMGARKAKELLFTARSMGAREAESVGMVNRVVPREDLHREVRELALSIARMHPFALRQAKRAVNQTLDVQGFYAAIQSVFDTHQTGHGHWLSETGLPVQVGLQGMKKEIKSQEVPKA